MPCFFLRSERSQINCYMLLTFIMAPCSPLYIPTVCSFHGNGGRGRTLNKFEDVASLDERQEFGVVKDGSVEQKYEICITIKQG